jgi:Integrase core domain
MASSRLNERCRDECLNEHLFGNLPAARRFVEEWRRDYNHQRPHTSLGGLTPIEFATRSRGEQGQSRCKPIPKNAAPSSPDRGRILISDPED